MATPATALPQQSNPTPNSTLVESQQEGAIFAPFWAVVSGLAILFGIGVRFWRLGKQSLWFDEGYTAWMVTHSPWQIIHLVGADTSPPLYYLLLRGWTDLFGHSEFALRSMSTVLMGATLILAAGIARRVLRNPPLVAAACWLMAVSYLQVQYAQEARAYALMAFLVVAGLDCLQRHLAADHRSWLGALAILLAASLYTHNVMIVYGLALGLAWLILPSAHSPRRRLLEASIVAAVAAWLYLPWLIADLPGQVHRVRQAFWLSPPTSQDFVHLCGVLLGIWHYESWNEILYHVHIPVGLEGFRNLLGPTVIAASLLGIILVLRGPRRREAMGIFLLAVVPPVVIAIYSVVRTPILMPKMFVASTFLLPMCVLAPLTIGFAKNGRIIFGTLIALLFLAMAATLGNFEHEKKEDWRSAAKVVAELPAVPRVILFVADDGQLPFDYYYRYRPGEVAGGVPADFFDRDPPLAMLRLGGAGDLDRLESLLNRNHVQEVVVVASHLSWADPRGLTLPLLRRHFAVEESTPLWNVTIIRFR